MITLVYPFRDRDLTRVRFSLNSLKEQSNKEFKVLFMDYGSQEKLSIDLKELVTSYSFAAYYYIHARKTLWNKSRVLNIALKKITTAYLFVADVDAIFSPEFVQVLTDNAAEDRVSYFQVGYLSKEESAIEKAFYEYTIKRYSTIEATGLSLFPVAALHKINGFDEFYHLWGSEDTDVQIRASHLGLNISYVDSKIHILHQWHEVYLNVQDTFITDKITVKDIPRINMNYLNNLKKSNRIKANTAFKWGEEWSDHSIAKIAAVDSYQKVSLKMVSSNKDLKNLFENNEIVSFTSKMYPSIFSFIYRLIRGISIEKLISDQILQYYINNYRDLPYQYTIDSARNNFQFIMIHE